MEGALYRNEGDVDFLLGRVGSQIWRIPAHRDGSRYIRQLEETLLNVTFEGCNLTEQSSQAIIQSLAFKLNCDFAGLSLNSATFRQAPQARAPHSMQFPAELTQKACEVTPRKLRLICVYFYTSFFFQDVSGSSLLNNYVLGARLDHGHVDNLKEPINISIWHNRSLEGYRLICAFWEEGTSEKQRGSWSPRGCHTEQPSPTQVICHCNHLSYFAVLMQLSRDPIPEELLPPLRYISLVGCSISVTASLFTILLHFRSRKKSDSIAQIHVNLHASALLLNSTFLLSTLLAKPSVSASACTALAAVLHYALLSCFTWMAMEGFNLYLLFVRVYNVYIHRYVLKLCAVGWGVPAVLVLFILAVQSSVYGLHTIPLSSSWGNSTASKNTSICWVKNPSVHHILVMGYSGLTSLFNLVVLAWVLLTLHRLRAREEVLNPRARSDVVTVLGLTVLLGTTWVTGFFSFSVFLVPQLFLFTILNSIYGFFLFLWFCSQRYHREMQVTTEMETFSSSQMMQ
ncbi:PREDICTED: probable G-protein coupled receptor 114 [Elephantulus edwardii]|uniref:probable G-protein coupled receptor 114 n=1 Tax=Elephantulus edwardii TaxID=28737 RepID=UPI0003F0A25B|nr:PREDICTED: probable G-protein coupled receptor 114 [Elephantulus edwardii]